MIKKEVILCYERGEKKRNKIPKVNCDKEPTFRRKERRSGKRYLVTKRS